MQVKPSLQMMTLRQTNAPSTVLSAQNFLNYWAWTSSTFTLKSTCMSMNTCGYHGGFHPKISFTKIRSNTYLLTTKTLLEFAKACIAFHNQDDLPIFHSFKNPTPLLHPCMFHTRPLQTRNTRYFFQFSC